MPVFKIHHVTKYQYDRRVKESINEVKIFPYHCAEQETLQHDLKITGSPEVQTFEDYWGNKIGTFSFYPDHTEMIIESRLVVRTITPAQFHADFLSDWDQLKQEANGKIQLIELASVEPIKSQPEIDRIVRSIFSPENGVAVAVESCSEFIFKNFQYIKGITTIETTVDDIIAYKAGVCQDFAHVLLQMLRTLHIPSRYVSGYICPNKNGMRGEGATHAWVEAWIPNRGWIGIDPTNNVWVKDTHVKLAVGRTFSDCTPVKGTFKGPARQKLSIHVSIGYEDGQVFEEINNVKMQAQPSLPDDDLYTENFSVQQQQ